MKKRKLVLLFTLAALSLAGCGGGKFNNETLTNGYYAYINNVGAVKYTVDTNISLDSDIYGETFKMKWKSKDVITRMPATGDLISERKVDATALENEYSETISNYLVGGKRYATYDGKAFFVTDYTPSAGVSKGPLSIVDAILADEEKTLTTQTGKVGEVECNLTNGSLTGPYLPYLIDDVNMTGLLDFKSDVDKDITFDYELYTSIKDKSPVLVNVFIRNSDKLFNTIISGMDSSNSGSVSTKVKSFSIGYTFNEFNGVNVIELPAEAGNATVTDNIDSLSISAVGNKKLDEESYVNVAIGDFEITVPDSWKAVDIVGNSIGYDGVDSHNKNYKPTRLGHKQSTSYVQVMNPVTLDKLVEKLEKAGIDTSEMMVVEEGEAGASGAGTEESGESVKVSGYNLDKITDGTVQYYLSQDYDSVSIDGNGEAPAYVMSSKGDVKKSYVFILLGKNDFCEVQVSLDGSELYKDYYDTVLSNLAGNFKYEEHTEEVVDSGEEVEETEAGGDTEAGGETGEETGEQAETGVEALSGTLKNPYKVNEKIQMKGIDLSSGNIVDEYATIKSINTEKLLVDQKLKEAGISVESKAALVNVVVNTDKVKFTEESELDLLMEVSLVDKDGNAIGKELNSGKPLNKEFKDGIVFKNDGETKQVVFAFEMTDDFDEETNLIKIKYNDPDLGDRALYVKLK